MSEWKTIDSAPRDGTNFQAWIDKYGWEPRCRINPETNDFEIYDLEIDNWDVFSHMIPTHWMPLPNPPVSP